MSASETGSSMIGYVTIGVRDLERAARFYDAVLAVLGCGRVMEFDGFIAWGKPSGGALLAITRPYDGNAPTVGNGVMIALSARDPEQVDAVYQQAIAQGGSDEGPPGPRGEGFYAGYFRDLDGNKLNAHILG